MQEIIAQIFENERFVLEEFEKKRFLKEVLKIWFLGIKKLFDWFDLDEFEKQQ